MSALPPGSLVLVTGVNGYIAAHVADQLLKAGYKIKGTARDLSKVESLKKRWKNNFEVVQVEDLTKDGAFDEAVKDVDAVCHLASPIALIEAKDLYRDYINPAVKGTLTLLNSVLQHGQRVKHVVVTSSIVTVLHPAPPGYIYTEEDWNNDAIKAFEHWKPGMPVDTYDGYIASKVEAEKALWKWKEEKHPSFKLTTILPGYVFGPFVNEVKSIDSLSSPRFVFRYFSGEEREIVAPSSDLNWVDVRDCALAHVRALQRGEQADGQRFITSKSPYTFQMVVDILRNAFPEMGDKIPLGHPGKHYETPTRVSGQKATKVLGINYDISLEQSIVDMCKELKKFVK